jgi:4-amino-4-deoxy-L-arabinose transferase-like glycosyltransferase
MTISIRRPDDATRPGRIARQRPTDAARLIGVRLLRGRRDDPAWVRPALLVVLLATGVLYLWGLGSNGDANAYYAAAVQSGTRSWKALFFGSFDSAGFITVDKPPASLWVMALSGRLFGFSTWSMLVPQGLEGMAAVILLYATVRRWSGAAAGLAAAGVLAVTPVAVLMFRYNNPDALLTLLLIAAAYGLTRAVERAGVGWLALAGTAVGFGFLTKMLQAFLLLPAFTLVYLVAAPAGLWRRLGHLALAGLALLASAGWWVAVVELWPASGRPYIGGSSSNSVLQLAFGYNGLGRVFGGSAGTGTARWGFPGAGALGEATGPTRLFGGSTGGQISWLLPAALLAFLAGLWLTGRAARTDRTRAALLLWGGWLLVTGCVFSFMKGLFHPYYTAVLAPPIAALVAVGGRELWRHRHRWPGRAGLATLVTATAAWDYVLLDRTASWHAEIRYALAAVGLLAVAALLVPARRRARTASLALATTATALLGSGVYAVATVATPHSGGVPTAGPAAATAAIGLPSATGGLPPGLAGSPPASGGSLPAGAAGTGGFPPGMPGGTGGLAGVGGFPGAGTGSTPGGNRPGGNPITGARVDPALATMLKGTNSRWAAATLGAISAGPLELASGKDVMAIGGFTGGDPAPTLDQFRQYVTTGQVRYFIDSGFAPASGGGSEIASWVRGRYASTTVGGQKVYDLTRPAT